MSHESPIPDAIPFRTLDGPSGAVKALIAVLVLAGVAAALMGAAGDADRVWNSLLFNWLFWSSVAMGMVMFAVALHLTDAQWAWSIRRFALGGAAFLPISFVLLFVVFGGYEHYFHHWLHPAGDPVLEAKAAWLNWPGLAIRDVVVVGVLFALGLAFAYYSLRPDVYGVKNGRHGGLYQRLTRDFRGVEVEARRSHDRMTRLGPVLGILYAVLWGIVAIDLAMSLSPHWFSTMYPVAFFWTAFHGGVAFTAIAVAVLRRPMGLERFITVRQYHDLGKLVFAFSVFWMYLNWSQYIVIWYGLLPWEQDWFVRRFSEPFSLITSLVVIFVFVMPFFGLLARPPKKVPAIVAFFSVFILLGHWLERFLLVVPGLWEGEGLPLGIPEIGIGLGFMGLFLAAYTWYLARFPILPSPATLAAAEPSVIEVEVPAAAAAEH